MRRACGQVKTSPASPRGFPGTAGTPCPAVPRRLRAAGGGDAPPCHTSRAPRSFRRCGRLRAAGARRGRDALRCGQVPAAAPLKTLGLQRGAAAPRRALWASLPAASPVPWRGYGKGEVQRTGITLGSAGRAVAGAGLGDVRCGEGPNLRRAGCQRISLVPAPPCQASGPSLLSSDGCARGHTATAALIGSRTLHVPTCGDDSGPYRRSGASFQGPAGRSVSPPQSRADSLAARSSPVPQGALLGRCSVLRTRYSKTPAPREVERGCVAPVLLAS